MTATGTTITGWWRSATGRERRQLLLAVLLGTLATLATPALLGLSGYLLARAAQAPPILELSAAIVGVRFFGLLRAAARYAERLVGHDLALGRLGRERVGLFETLIARVPGQLGGRTSTDVLDGLVADVDRLADLPVRVIVPAAALTLSAVLCVAAAGALLPAAGVVLAVALVLEAVALALPVLHDGRRAQARAAAREALSRELVTVLDAAPELVAWGVADRYAERVQDAGSRVDHLTARAARAASAGTSTAIAAGGFAAAAVLAVAVPAAADGRIDGVLVAALALLALGATEVLGALPDVLVARGEVRAAAVRLGQLASAGAGATPEPGGADPADGVVRVRGLRIERSGRRILDGVDLDVAAAERVALTGPSGCGKSTLADVLVGFARADGGTVEVGGIDLSSADGDALRSRVRLAPQDPHVFPTTIAANVRIAAPAADDATIEAALRAVGAGPWLDALPHGLDTRLGEFGERCSGGERQRIGLARALLAGGDLIILDEPASQLPADEAVEAIAAVLDVDPRRGALLVAHRPQEVCLADRQVALAA